MAMKENEEKAEFARATPPPEIVAKMLEEGKALGDPQYKQNGTMTFDYFLDTSKIIVKFTYMQTKEGLAEHAVKRREAIKAGDEDLFNKLILETANWEQLSN